MTFNDRMHYPGGKGRSYRELINLIPPHVRYVETHLGSGAVFRRKRPAVSSIGIDLDPAVISHWRAIADPSLTLIEGDALAILPTLGLGARDLVYCDPPYFPATRRQPRCYRFDYDEHDHERLLATLLGLDCCVVLSGYRNGLYDEALAGWHRTDYLALTHRGQVLESAWTNFAPGPLLHDYSYVGDDFRARERFRRRADGLARRILRSDPLELHAALARVAAEQPEAVLAAAERIPA